MEREIILLGYRWSLSLRKQGPSKKKDSYLYGTGFQPQPVPAKAGAGMTGERQGASKKEDSYLYGTGFQLPLECMQRFIADSVINT